MNIFVPFWKIYKEQFKKTAEKRKKAQGVSAAVQWNRLFVYK